MGNPTSPSPGAGYVWVDGQTWGDDGAQQSPGFWQQNPWAGMTTQAPPAQNTVGGPNAAIAANWQMSQPLQNQFAELLTNPVSGYSPQANYGARLGRFQFSGTAPVPQTAPKGWGRYPGVDGSPPSAPWLAGQTMPPPKWGNTGGVPTQPVTPPGNYVGGGGTGGTTTPPPSTGGWTTSGPPSSWTGTPLGYTGAGVTPEARQSTLERHQAARAAQSAGENISPQTGLIDQNKVYGLLGITNPQVWTSPTTNTNYNGAPVQWSPGDFASPAAGTWQANWNALTPALRVAYGSALGSPELLRSIYQQEGHSTEAGAQLVNSMQQNGVRYAVENGQLVMKSVDPYGVWTTTPLANLLNPQAPRKVRSI
jgi:hypothetical protein